MKFRMACILIFIILISINLSAHEHKKQAHRALIEDSSRQERDTAIINPQKVMIAQEKTKTDKPFKLNYLHETFSHMHNKLVHFPIALTFLAAIFTFLSFKWKQFEFSVKYIVLIAAIISIPVIFSGLAQASDFVGDAKEWIVGIHKIMGICVLSLLWLWFIFLIINPIKKYAWLIAIICFLLVTITGFYGGIIAQ